MNAQHANQPEQVDLQFLDKAGFSNAFSQAEAGAQLSDTRFRTLMEHIAEGIFIASGDGRYMDANPCALDMLGHKRSELTGRNITDTVVESERLRVKSELSAAMSGHLCYYEWKLLRQDGSVFRTDVCVRLLSDGHLLGILTDKDKRSQAEQALRESEARTHTLAENLPVGVFMASPDGQNIYTNPAIHKQLGRSFGEMLGEIWAGSVSVHDDDRERMMQAWKEFCAGISPFDIVARFVRPDGVVRFIHSRATAVQAGGRVICYVGSADDITERRQAEEKIKVQLDELRRWHDVTLGREERIQELKREVNELLLQLGKSSRYANAETNDATRT